MDFLVHSCWTGLFTGLVGCAVSGLSFLVGFYATMLSVPMATVAVFSVAGRLDARIVRALNLMSGLALLGSGLYQIWAALTAAV